ncbi:hypothetical protein [Sphingobacterium yanglingense]|uniref:Uncharacterized protein n=1 Tax=Sphingobacterium yanglingense TaxID=1437280 RepID=A0A4R6WMS8_9SPHI|nr:hypothetical protein [Sphingobacterium yanglingense]TDQ80148.1 hypothetical protein CLV99_1603 [Sphingobacterium yanglingense]
MKHIALILLLVFSTLTNAQTIKHLSDVGSKGTVPNGQAIIYGNFIQRLGFASGGFAQDIRLMNIDTKEVFAFRVKPTFKSSKENTFIYFIEPGNYAILNYWWTHSKWYGGKMFTESIFKGIDATEGFEERINSGEVDVNALHRYTFTITENSLNYLGTWHFDNPVVSFTDDKEVFDEKVKNKYKKLDFLEARVVLPN